MGKKEIILLIALAAAGLLLHGVYLGQISGNPFFESPVLDEAIHFEWASRLAAGEEWAPGEPYFRAPLYPLFLSILFRITDPGFFWPRLVQIILSLANPILLYFLGRIFFPRNTAAVAAIALLGYGVLYYFASSLLIVSLLIPLNIAFLLLLAIASRKPERPVLWFLSGLLLGVSAIARPNILLFGVLLPFWALLLPELRRRYFLLFLLPFAGGAALPIAPVSLHNLAAGDRVLISWQGGINFHIGNNPESDGMTAIAPGTEGTWWGGYQDMVRIAEAEEGRALRRSEVSRYWFSRGLRFLRDEPVRAARLLLRKTYLLMNDFEVSNNQGIYFFRRYSTLLSALMSFGFGLLFPLACAGFILIRWDRRSLLLPLFLAAYSASIILFFVTARYRMPMIPVLMLPAAFALHQWSQVRRTGPGRRMWASIALFVGMSVLSNSNVLGLDREKTTQGEYNVGVVHLKARRFEEAIPFFRKALEDVPEYRNARYNLGLCYSYLDRLEEAEKELEELLQRYPDYAPGRVALASVLERSGRREGALLQLERALSVDPENGEARNMWRRLAGDGP